MLLEVIGEAARRLNRHRSVVRNAVALEDVLDPAVLVDQVLDRLADVQLFVEVLVLIVRVVDLEVVDRPADPRLEAVLGQRAALSHVLGRDVAVIDSA